MVTISLKRRELVAASYLHASLLSGLLLWSAACRLDTREHDACRTQRDCIAGRVCQDGRCLLATPQGDAGQADADTTHGGDNRDAAADSGDLQLENDAGPGAEGGTSTPTDCGPLYVRESSLGGHALSWAEAANDLQSTIDAAAIRVASGCTRVEVWVGSGIYRPKSKVSRSASFELASGVEIYGGFKGDETERDQRDVANHLSVLSGDRHDDDDSGNRSDNSYHVVRASGVDETALLNGFVITGGHADSVDGSGGGLYYSSASPVLEQLVFVDNRAKLYGGGLSGQGGHPTVRDSVFAANDSDFYGGGAHFGMGQAALERVTFVANTADAYAGALAAGDVTMRDVLFVGNVAKGVSSIAGGLGVLADGRLDNMLFVGNEGGWASALYAGEQVQVLGSSFVHNVTDGILGGTFSVGLSGRLALKNSIVWHNLPAELTDDAERMTITTSDVQNLNPPGTGNLSADPLFAGLPAATGSWTQAPSYDAARMQTRFTDTSANFVGLTGSIVRVRVDAPPKTASYAVIARRSSSELWVWGNLAEHAAQGVRYELLDLHLAKESPCRNAAVLEPRVPEDLAGRTRGDTPDMGALEYVP